MLESHFSGTLDQSHFPYVRDAPLPTLSKSSSHVTGGGAPGSLRSARPQWTTASGNRGKKVASESRQRVIVFVAGGVTWSETRLAYKLSGGESGSGANKDIYIGESRKRSRSF